MPMTKRMTVRRPRPGPRREPSGWRRAAALGLTVAAACACLATFASPAGAAGESISGCVIAEAISASQVHGSLEAVENNPKALKELDSAAERCLESPNPIFPAVDEIIWGGLAFAILFVFMWRKGFPAVKRVMDARSEKIRADLDAADQAKTEAQRTRGDYEAQLADAKTAAAAIIDEAREQAGKLRADLQARAETEIVEQRARAAAEIEASRRQAIDDLRSEVAAIAVGAAERVVGASLDADAHRALIDGYIDEVVGAGSKGRGE